MKEGLVGLTEGGILHNPEWETGFSCITTSRSPRPIRKYGLTE